jgi:hypothetical protein
LGPPPAVSPEAAIARETLAVWTEDLTMAYLGAVLAAFVLGRLHALAQR